MRAPFWRKPAEAGALWFSRRVAVVVILFAALNGAGLWWIRQSVLPRVDLPRVSAVYPTGTSPNRPVISVTFSEKVIPRDPGSWPAPDGLLRLEPRSPGKALWTDPNRLVYQLSEDLGIGQEYKIILSGEIGRILGTPLDGPREFSFKTETIKLLQVSQVTRARNMTVTLRLKFNRILSPHELTYHLRIVDPDEKEIPFSFLTSSPASEIDVQCQLRQDRLAVVFGPYRRKPDAPAGESPGALRVALKVEAESRHELRVEHKLRLNQAYADYPSLAACTLKVDFSNHIPQEQRLPEEVSAGSTRKLADFFAVEPAVPFTISARWSEVQLQGDFQPGGKYVVTVKKGLRDATGDELQADAVRTVTFPNRSPSLGFHDEGTFLSSQGNLSVLLNVVNAEKVNIQPHRIQPNNLVHYLKLGSYLDSFTRSLGTKVYELPPAPDQIREVAVDLRDLLGPDPRGAWYLSASIPEDSAQKLVVVSDLGISAKLHSDGFTAWITSLRTAEPVEGAKVSLWSASNQLIAESPTNPEGLVSFSGPLKTDDGPPYALLASKGEDISYLLVEGTRLDRTDFEVEGKPYFRKGFEAYLYTDRGVYRPGEEVHLRALVRGTSPAQDLSGLPLEVETVRPDGKRFRLDKAALSASGSIDVSIKIPPSAATGLYDVRLGLPRESASEETRVSAFGDISFRVEEFMPNRLRAELRLAGDKDPSARLRPLEEATVLVRGMHLFGLPAAGCQVEARWSLQTVPFQCEEWKGFFFGELSPKGLNLGREVQGGALDEKGELLLKWQLPQVETASSMLLRVVAFVKDVGNRPVTAQLNVPVDPAPVYVGLKAAEDKAPEAGRAARFECVVVRPDGKLAEHEALELIASSVRWTSILKKSDRGGYYYDSHSEIQEISRSRVALSSGRGAFEFTFPSPGSYRLRLKDPGSAAAAELSLYASGAGASPWMASMEKPEAVELALQKAAYRPGETARAIVRAPFGGTLLLTTETDRVETARVFQMPSNVFEVDVPVPGDAAENFYVAASVVRKIDPSGEWVPHRAYGVSPVPVDLSQKRLFLTIQAPAELAPRLEGRARVVVAGEDGSPMQGAEVALALVDEGILSLTGYRTPDPFSHFYAKRSHAVELCDTYAELLSEVPLQKERARPGGDKSSGGGEGRHLSPVVAQRVKSTVLWLGAFTSDAEGSVLASFQVPQFTGELRLYAVASATGHRFGSAAQPVLVRAPFMLELGLPRFLAPGDSFLAPVQAFNRTGTAGTAALTWNLNGLVEGNLPPAEGLTFASLREPTLVLPAGGSGRMVFPIRASDRAGVATATLSGVLGQETFSETVELAVRPAAPRVSRSESGSITSDKPLEISLPARFLEGTGRYKLVLSGFPDVELSSSLLYLIHYPYGCLEQTTSSVFPLVHMRDLVDRLGLLASSKEQGDARARVSSIDEYIVAGIERILDMQSLAGWFATWPGGHEPWRWGSVYAGHFLVEAKAAGYPVPGPELELLLGYLKEVAKERRTENLVDTLERVYALYVLALAGKPDIAMMDKLREEALLPEPPQAQGGPEPFPPTGKYLLGAAYVLARKPDLARELLGEGLPGESSIRDTGGLLRSPAREAAILLSSMLDVDPASPRVPQLVERLKKHRVESRWYTTQENAFALLALGKYAKLLSSEPQGFTAEVRIGDKPAVMVGAQEHRTFEGTLYESPVRVTLPGPGTLFYTWIEEGVPVDGRVEEADSGIIVRRRFLDRDGKDLDISAIPCGEVVLVEISLEMDHPSYYYLENVAVVDMLPAGLEVENPNLQGGLSSVVQPTPTPAVKPPETPSPVPGTTRVVRPRPTSILSPSHVSLRDDRVILFFNLGRQGGVHRHACRAVTRGEFRLPPVLAEALYDPSVRSLHGGGKLTVR